MVPRSAKILKEDLDYTGKVPLSKVRAAQNQIAVVVDTLALNGEIEIIDEKFV
jgi:flagellar motor switch protein FliG